MKTRSLWIGLGVVISGLVLLLLAVRTGNRVMHTVAAPPVVYLDRQTGQLVVASPEPVHLDAGRPARVRALYCSRCERWCAVPSTYPGNPRSYLCPRHHRPMSEDGPISAVPQTPRGHR